MPRTETDICNLALLHAGINQKIGSRTDLSDPAAQACNVLFDEHRRQIFNEFRWSFSIRRQQLGAYSGAVYDSTHTYAAGDLAQFGVNVYRSLLNGNLANEPDLDASSGWWAQVTRDGYLYACPTPPDMLDPIAVWPKQTTTALSQPSLFVFPKDVNIRNPRSDERVPYRLENSNDGTDNQILLTDVQFPILKYVADVTNASAFPTQFVEVFAWKMAEILSMALRGDEKKAAMCAARYRVELGSAFVSDMRDQQEDPEPVSEFESAREGCL